MIYPLLLLFSFLYLLSSSKVLNSGDAGEFVVSSLTLGIAHPSGYPLYVEILKLFSFLPIGNLSFRMVLASVVFSILSLFLVYLVSIKITKDKWCGLFIVTLLAVSYSFWGQSVVMKFYPLNLFLILIVIYYVVKTIIDGYERKYQFIISLILGLTLSNHHTGFMIALPLLVLSLFYWRDVLRNLPLSFLFFIAGFLVNLHMLIRGQKGFAMNNVFDLESFLFVFLRKTYEKGSSPEIAKNLTVGIEGYWYAFKNIAIILYNNFPLYTFPLFLLGLWFCFRFSKKLFIFLLSCFVTYSFLLAKLVFSQSLMNADAWYIGAHQYFLPMLALFAIFTGFGFLFILKPIYGSSMKLVKILIPISAIFIISLGIFERLIDQNFNRNYIPHIVNKTIISSLPIGSVYLTFGDNHTFQAWYFPKIEIEIY